jgi:alcohol dehydrogenase class IV
MKQEILRGENSIRRLKDVLEKQGCSSIFLISGKHFKKSAPIGLFGDIKTHHFVKAGPNVEVREVQEAYNEFSAERPDALISIGGGSVIDLGKAILHRCTELSASLPFFVAAPTTAGSGSEATHFAVVYKEKQKYSLVDDRLLPQLVVLDPSLTYSLSKEQTAITGMDMFSQAVESFWNVNATIESKKWSAESILLWKEDFIAAVNDPQEANRRKMMEAAYMAGQAINVTRTTGPHALSYYLTIHHHIPHGQAVGLFLPLFFIYNKPDQDLLDLLDMNGEYEAMQFIQQKMKEAGLATQLAELGLSKENIVDRLLEAVNEERFANNPVPFNKDLLKQLIIEYL